MLDGNFQFFLFLIINVPHTQETFFFKMQKFLQFFLFPPILENVVDTAKTGDIDPLPIFLLNFRLSSGERGRNRLLLVIELIFITSSKY